MVNKQNDRRYILGCLAALLLLVVIDQCTKVLAVQKLKDQDAIVWIPGVFELLYLENRGAAFGIFENMRWMFLFGTGLILVLTIFLFRRFPKKRKYIPFLVSLTMIAAGGIGNLIDRLRLGYVIDFFYFSLIDFPVFNVADIYVVCSGIFLVFCVCFKYKDESDFRFLNRKN